jgi:agmatine deiminase
MTTESCLLNPNRGLSLDSRAAVEAVLKEAFGASAVLWISAGLVGDHTDGHIDNIARFVAEGAVVHMQPSGDDDPNRAGLLAIEAQLRSMRAAGGAPLTLHAIPSPGRVLGASGEVIAASYCNFYLGNAVIVMPTFGTPNDALARASLARIFPRHSVIGSPAKNFLEGGGTFHCMTRQIPEAAVL